ncbi:cyclin-U4-1-like [Salvia miltiorrhiza]|uniref:cyclin-U4-1-like n=1 Tax=Salvia miltiorrhiza TaxID=226208 RepID=UPI0025AC28F8|nr:cyclin-U4-1-like [Salvia miltiorrhiza]
MGALSFEPTIFCPLDYVTLGLKDPIKDYLGKPRVLSLLSSILDKTVKENEKMLETSEAEDVITVFHGTRAPSLSIQQYIDRIFRYSNCSPSCFVIAHIYVDRFIHRTNLRLNSLNIHRLLITSVMVAAKFMDDAFFNNAYYARVGGITTRELNKLEMKFLFGVDFQLHVSVQTFKKYCSTLKQEASCGLIERSIPVCGTEDGCTSNDDDSLYSHSTSR